MKLALIILFLTVQSSANNRAEHIPLHAGISSVSSLIAYEYGYTRNQSILIGFTTSLLIGLVKEAQDTNFDHFDIISNTIGGTIGVAPVLFYYKF